jgi:hypothetical protein
MTRAPWQSPERTVYPHLRVSGGAATGAVTMRFGFPRRSTSRTRLE